MARNEPRSDAYPRWLWPALAAPGLAWLIILFVVPFYVVLAVSLGTVDPITLLPVPALNPAHWNVGFVFETVSKALPGQVFADVFVRTVLYVVLAVAGCLAIGYPTAYYIALYARRSKVILVGMIILPFWVSYLMRMLAWVNLLAPDGYVNRILVGTHVLDQPYNWLGGKPLTVVLALIYGYIPFLIVALYASLERLDRSMLEAARDLGANRIQTFLRITLPMSKIGVLGGCVIIALPMFGDYYTANIVSGSPHTSMIGNQIDLYFHGGPQPAVGATLTLLLSGFLAFLMSYYVYTLYRGEQVE